MPTINPLDYEESWILCRVWLHPPEIAMNTPTQCFVLRIEEFGLTEKSLPDFYVGQVGNLTHVRYYSIDTYPKGPIYEA
jgi:hypothetical protein